MRTIRTKDYTALWSEQSDDWAIEVPGGVPGGDGSDVVGYVFQLINRTFAASGFPPEDDQPTLDQMAMFLVGLREHIKP